MPEKAEKSPKSPENAGNPDDPPSPLSMHDAGPPLDPPGNYRRIMIPMGHSAHTARHLGVSDNKWDPWLLRTGEKVPKGWSPRMTTVPMNVTVDERGVLKAEKFTKAQARLFGAPLLPGTESPLQDHLLVGSLLRRPEDLPKEYAAAARERQYGRTMQRIIWPKYYQNPYHFQDMMYLQDIYANTIVGRVIETLQFFTLAQGIRPKLRVRYPGAFKSDEERRKYVEEHHWMIDEIMQVEEAISHPQEPLPFDDSADHYNDTLGPIGKAESPDQPAYDVPLQKKWASAFILAAMFGRSIIVPRVDPEDNRVTVRRDGEDKAFTGIPKINIVVHPRDMGFNYVDYVTHRLLGIQLNNANWILKPNEMVFWEWNPDNPVYGSKYYGMSMAQSMMGSARTLRKIIEVDLPLIAETRWSGMYWLVFKRKGELTATSDAELGALLDNVELNGINAVLEDDPTKDMMVHKVDLDPKISELLEMVRELVKYIMGQIGLPEGLMYGEDALNRDTLQKKITAWTKGPVKRYRTWFLEPITHQWYARLGATLAKQDPRWREALRDIEVYADVEEFKLEDMEAQIRVLQLLENTMGKPFTDEAKAEWLGIMDLPNWLDPNKGRDELSPLPQGRSSYVMTESDGRRTGIQEHG